MKLSAACAWLISPAQVAHFVMLTALSGGLLAGVYLIVGRIVGGRTYPSLPLGRGPPFARVWRIERWRISRRASLPYGCAIAAATLLIMLSG